MDTEKKDILILAIESSCDETAAEVSDAPADEAPADRPEDAMTE